jgi:DnaJ-class molecular chaperone
MPEPIRQKATLVVCPECKGKGHKVVNPRWPSGKQPYCELCATCSGMGEVEDNA